MAWQKGRQAGFGYKAEALALWPGLVCRRKEGICDLVGFVVYDGEKPIASACGAIEAWDKAHAWAERQLAAKK